MVHGQASWHVGARQKWTATVVQPFRGPSGMAMKSILLRMVSGSTSSHLLCEEREMAQGKDAQRLVGNGE